jgi:hypothetical protein
LNWRVNRTENIKELRRNAQIFDYLCQASSELNDIFSFPVLLILIVKFFIVVCAAFTFIYSFTYSNIIRENSTLVPQMIFVSEWVGILIIFTAADMPVTQVIQIDIDPESYHLCPIPNRIQVRLLRERLCTLSNSGSSKSLAENITVVCVSLLPSSIANHHFVLGEL